MIAAEDKVVSRYTSIATDTERFMGRPPTGRVIRMPAIQIFRFAGGKIVESWAVRDDLGTLRQLGYALSLVENGDADITRRPSSADVNWEAE